MTRPLLRLTALAAALFWSGVAIAQEAGPPPGGEPPEGRMRGGRLYISPAGEPFRGPDGLTRWFEGADTNHDGALSPDEFRADAMRFFKVLDANGDGTIDGTENGVYETQIVPEILQTGPDAERPQGGRGGGGGHRGGHGGGGMGGGGGGGHGGGMGGGMGRSGGGAGEMGGYEGGTGEDATNVPRGSGRGAGGERREGAARFSLLDIPQPVRGADANLDWKVSAAEWAKAAGQRFALLDTAKAGKLTLDTLPPLPGRARPRTADHPTPQE